jgi:hypothetical protein
MQMLLERAILPALCLLLAVTASLLRRRVEWIGVVSACLAFGIVVISFVVEPKLILGLVATVVSLVAVYVDKIFYLDVILLFLGGFGRLKRAPKYDDLRELFSCTTTGRVFAICTRVVLSLVVLTALYGLYVIWAIAK